MDLAWDIIIKKTGNFEFKRGITSFVNPYSMLMIRNEAALAEAVDQWCVDGISLVNVLNRKFHKNIRRYSFDDTSLTYPIFSFAKTNGNKIAVIGTREIFLKEAITNIEEKHEVKVHYSRNGYFNSKEERKKCIREIIETKIEIVICGMGTPYQERFLVELKDQGWVGYGFTCGGYLHQSAQKKNYYPEFFDKLNIRWVYRIIDEPKLFRRYFIDYPIFFIKFAFYTRHLR
jgi:N-acetylglucosaminyldiphosphoundecaprenol N-acetyl-beta-D-mannosaminyltransferase